MSNYYHILSESFQLDNIDLTFTSNAIEAIVDKAIKRKTGARALRSTLEEIMLDIMYDFPSIKDIKECKITSAVILSNAEPVVKKIKKIA